MFFLAPNTDIKLDELIYNMGDGVAITDKDLRFIGVNKKMADFYGTSIENLIGKTAFDVHPNFKSSVFYEAIVDVINTGNENSKVGYSEILGTWIVIRGKKINDYFVMITNDLKELKETNESYLKSTDRLTGLPNRYNFEDNIKNYNNNYSCILIDIKKFSLINQSLGTKVADFLLMSVASKLKYFCSNGEILYRLNADQFLLLGKLGLNAKQKCIDIMNFFINPTFVLNNKLFLEFNFSILHSTSMNKNTNPLKCLEIALEKSKLNESNFIEYSPLMERVDNPIERKEEILKAITNNQFELYFQPQVNSIDSSIIGAEALIRWNHSEEGFLYPGSFLNTAKELGLMKKIDKWVLNELIIKIHELESNDLTKFKCANMHFSINLSSDTLNDYDTQDYFIEKLSLLSFKNICFEITESGFVDINKSQNFINKLRNLGFLISIDDFGTGYCSLEYLLNYPTDFLKIERSFLKEIHSSNKSKSLISNIIKLGHSLNIQLVCEGVETKEDFELLQLFNCDVIQGYYFSKPLSFDNFIKFCLNGKVHKNIACLI